MWKDLLSRRMYSCQEKPCCPQILAFLGKSSGKELRRYIARQAVGAILGVSRTNSPATDYTDYTKKTPRE